MFHFNKKVIICVFDILILYNSCLIYYIHLEDSFTYTYLHIVILENHYYEIEVFLIEYFKNSLSQICEF